ncbi:creatininase family protein [Rhizobium sp. TRM95796]|uniref:creatininase family protein n=1 Tax=Rhizobium sp. TRM95796 TaxID=2979862 RepID=UPI0021E7656B|nr:creatininase family protein [Rhizobium sp. TRM95796]MCV3765773.1 creatininase family protein [Rhizobium sp. TRM95796]
MSNMPGPPPGGWSDRIAILPLGAHEYHGPHLPLQTDAVIVEGMAARLEAALGARDVILLPVEPVGYSPEHLDRPGTRSLGYQEAIERWLGMAETLRGQGVGRLMLLNAHGGNSPLLSIVAMEARLRFGMLCVATSWTRFGIPVDIVPPERKAFDIHGGEIETSVMLALRPDLVEREKCTNFASRQADFARNFTHLRAYGPHAFGWMMRDLNDKGAAGDARLATSEKGEALLTHAVSGLVELVDDMARFDLSLFSPGGRGG